MKNISKENFKNVFKKILIKIFAIFFLLIIISPISFSFAANPASVTDVPSTIPTDGKGLVPACAHLAADGSAGPQCTLQDLFGMIKPIRNILVTLVVIVTLGFAFYSGIVLVWSNDIPEYRQKIKKAFKASVIALIVLVVAPSLVVAALVSFGFNQDILGVIKQIFSFNDFNLIPHALAQASTTASTSNQYISLFPHQEPLNILQRAIRFFINYIAAPILSFGVIWAGFRFVKAEGNPEELASAKKFATWVVIAIAIAIVAPLALNILISTILAIIG